MSKRTWYNFNLSSRTWCHINLASRTWKFLIWLTWLTIILHWLARLCIILISLAELGIIFQQLSVRYSYSYTETVFFWNNEVKQQFKGFTFSKQSSIFQCRMLLGMLSVFLVCLVALFVLCHFKMKPLLELSDKLPGSKPLPFLGNILDLGLNYEGKPPLTWQLCPNIVNTDMATIRTLSMSLYVAFQISW